MSETDNYKPGIIVSQPSAEDLMPTPEQLAEQRVLSDWEKRSKKIDWVVGEPYKLFRN